MTKIPPPSSPSPSRGEGEEGGEFRSFGKLEFGYYLEFDA